MRLLYFLLLTGAFISCQHTDPIHPQRKNLVEAVYASGKIIAGNEYYVYALNGGTITKKLVKEGDSVKKGQVLYVINADVSAARMEAASSNYKNVQNNLSARSGILNDLRLSVQSAQTKVTNDSQHYVRLKNLFAQGVGMQSTLDNANAAYLIALNQRASAEEKYSSAINDLNVSLHNSKSELTGAAFDLHNNYIKSETEGTVYQTLKEAGEAVRPNETVALIGSSTGRIIRLSVDQQDINKIKVGQEVLLKTDVAGNTIYQATVIQVYPTMNEADQTFRVDAQFNKSTGQPYIHSSVEANIIVQKKNDALIIPIMALLNNDSVQVKEGSSVKTIGVKTGIKTLNEVEIVSGLNESSQIILPLQK